MKNNNQQSGRGLTTFILGLAIATLIIAAVIYFINQSNKKVFKDTPESQPKVITPEVLVPKSDNEDNSETADNKQNNDTNNLENGNDIIEWQTQDDGNLGGSQSSQNDEVKNKTTSISEANEIKNNAKTNENNTQSATTMIEKKANGFKKRSSSQHKIT